MLYYGFDLGIMSVFYTKYIDTFVADAHQS